MTRVRVAAGAAGVLTALLLQATVVGPVWAPVPVSLPAVLVMAVALVDGPATGMAFGFAMGLVADLGSHHPAGVLALCWLGLGLVGGTVRTRRRVLRDAVLTGAVCALAGAVAGILLVLVGGQTLSAVFAYTLPALGGDVLIALVVLPLVRWMLGNEALRAPRPVLTSLSIGGRRG